MTDRPRLLVDETGAQRTLGYEVDVSGDDGRARVRLVLDERHTNRHGTLHGGLISVLLDSAMGVTGSMRHDPVGLPSMLTISMTTNFLASARVGDRLTAIGRVTGGGRKLSFIEGEIRREDGTVIATGSGVFKPAPATERV